MNRETLVAYFESGCKDEQLLGLELEHFVVDKSSKASLPYYSGVEKLLEKVAPLYGEPILSQGRIIGISRKNADITLEPAAQLEISIGPFRDAAEIKRTYDEFTDILAPALEEINAELACVGYHPVSKIDELPIIPKERYGYMYKHFESTGTCGKYMMKGSASTQVSIDYLSEEDFAKKFRVANILGPLFSLLCDNTPVFEGKPATHGMIRTHIWNNVDPRRCMVVQDALDNTGFGFNEYAQYLLDMPEIFKSEERTVEHIASMVFPDVRLKTSIELRMADSLPIDGALKYLELIKGIFYDKSKLDELYRATKNIKNADVSAAKEELIKNGENAAVYGRKAAELIKEWLCEGFER